MSEYGRTADHNWFKWMKTLFPLEGLGWRVLAPLMSLAVVAVMAAVRLSLHDQTDDVINVVSDGLETRVRIWHLVLLFTAESVIAGIVVVARRRRDVGSREKITVWSFCPKEVKQFGVLWPITTVNNGARPTGFTPGRPMCLKCHTPLSWKIDDQPVPLSDDGLWETIASENMQFQCPLDHAYYDLTTYKWNMGGLMRFVSDIALGEYRAAQAAAWRK